jgi:hypothetical protein
MKTIWQYIGTSIYEPPENENENEISKRRCSNAT